MRAAGACRRSKAWPTRTKAASPTTTCSPGTCWSTTRVGCAWPAWRSRPRPTPAASRPAPCAWQRDAAQRDVLARLACCTRCCRACPRSTNRHRPRHRAPAAVGARDRCPALDHDMQPVPGRCAPSSTAPPTAGSTSATATRWLARAIEGWQKAESGAGGGMALAGRQAARRRHAAFFAWCGRAGGVCR